MSVSALEAHDQRSGEDGFTSYRCPCREIVVVDGRYCNEDVSVHFDVIGVKTLDLKLVL